MKKVVLFFIASTICVLGNSQSLGGLVSKDRSNGNEFLVMPETGALFKAKQIKIANTGCGVSADLISAVQIGSIPIPAETTIGEVYTLTCIPSPYICFSYFLPY